MKPEIRQTPEGIELYIGNAESFRAWPLTWDEVGQLVEDLAIVYWEHRRNEALDRAYKKGMEAGQSKGGK